MMIFVKGSSLKVTALEYKVGWMEGWTGLDRPVDWPFVIVGIKSANNFA